MRYVSSDLTRSVTHHTGHAAKQPESAGISRNEFQFFCFWLCDLFCFHSTHVTVKRRRHQRPSIRIDIRFIRFKRNAIRIARWMLAWRIRISRIIPAHAELRSEGKGVRKRVPFSFFSFSKGKHINVLRLSVCLCVCECVVIVEREKKPTVGVKYRYGNRNPLGSECVFFLLLQASATRDGPSDPTRPVRFYNWRIYFHCGIYGVSHSINFFSPRFSLPSFRTKDHGR